MSNILPDFNYYKTAYRHGMETPIPETEFLFFANAAWDEINSHNIHAVTFKKLPDIVKRLTCEIAELLHRESKAPQAGDIKGESNVGYSYSIADGMNPKEISAEIQQLVQRRLIGSPTEIFNAFVSRVM